MSEFTITRSSQSRLQSSNIGLQNFVSFSASRVIITTVIIALVVLSFPFSVDAQSSTDYIALVDISESMFDQHEDTVVRVLEGIVSEQLNSEDTFHLLSFGGSPEFELRSRIEGRQSVEDIVSHLLLLKPLDVHTDFTAAMKYLVEYVDGLSLSSSKQILIVTDGNNDPPPDSPYHDPEENRRRIQELSNYMKRNGWDVKALHFDSDTDDGKSSALMRELEESFDKKIVVEGSESTTEDEVLRPHVQVGFPEGELSGKEQVVARFEFTNPGEEGRTLRIEEVRHSGDNILMEPQAVTLTPGETRNLSLPLQIPEGVGTEKSRIDVQILPSQGGPLEPSEGALRMRRTEGLFAGVNWGLPVLWILVGLVVLILIILLVRRLVTAAPTTTGTQDRRPVGTSAGTDLSEARAGKGGEDETEHTLKGAARHRTSSGAAADTLSKARSSAKTDDAESTLAGRASERKEEHPLRKSGADEMSEAADILSRASSRGSESQTPAAAGKSESPERQLQKASQERKAKQSSSKAGLPARRGTRSGGPVLPSPKESNVKTLTTLRNEGKKPVEMKVDFQRNTGTLTNLLWFEEGTSYSVGAPGEAEFAISAIPVEGIIGHVVMEKGKLVFYSESRRYFPELDKPVRDCMKTPIMVRSPQNEEETVLRFREYIHPLERINRIMHLIDKPGKPDFDY